MEDYSTINLTKYLGENKRGDIIWGSYSLGAHSTKLIKGQGEVCTLAGEVVGHDADAGRLFYRLPDQQHIVAVDDQAFEQTPTLLSANCRQFFRLNNELAFFDGSALRIANNHLDAHPRLIYSFDNKLFLNEAVPMSEEQLFVKVGWENWRVLDLEYSKITQEINFKSEFPAARVLSPYLIAFEIFHQKTLSSRLIIYDVRQRRTNCMASGDTGENQRKRSTLMNYDRNRLVRQSIGNS